MGGKGAPAPRVRGWHGRDVIKVPSLIVQRGAFGPSDSRQGAAGCREGECSHGADAAFWRAATRAGALEPTRSQGLAQPNVAAGPTLPARQTCVPPTVRRALQVAMRDCSHEDAAAWLVATRAGAFGRMMPPLRERRP